MHNLTENTLAHEVETHHFRLAVAAIFQLHAMALRALGGFHQRPAFLEGHRAGDLNCSMLAMFHRVKRNRRVHSPGSSNINQIDIALAKRFIAFFAGVHLGLFLAVLLQPNVLSINALFEQIAQSRNLHAWNRRKPTHCARTAHPQSADTNAHTLERRGGEGAHRTSSANLRSRSRATSQSRRSAHPGRSSQKIATIHVCRHF